jgi:FAD:protein FMN transferase
LPWNRPLIIIVLVLLLALTWWRLPSSDPEVRRSQLAMGTVVEIVAGGLANERLEKAVSAAFTEIARLDRLLSRYQPESDVSRLSAPVTEVRVAPETAEVIALGLDVARRSQGAFDLTLGRLKGLWAFEEDTPRIPDRAAIREALDGIGPGALTLSGQLVRKRAPSLMVDLGGIAKGYIVDRAAQLLRDLGVSYGAVNAGGDMMLIGQPPERPWRIGIQDPRAKGSVVATVQVSNRAVVTSGDYERFFLRDGQRYHHIFDPKSGIPARLCQSVTVITDSVALGDALATAIFVLGPEAGLDLLADYPHSEALIIAADGSHHASPGWAASVVSP